MSLQEGLERVRTLRGSKIPSHQKQVALLDAVEAILREEGQEANSTAYFATLLTLLDRPDAAESATELLAVVVPYVHQQLLASKIDFAVAKLLPILLNESATEGTALIRSSIAVLEAILTSVDPLAWNIPLNELGALRTFSGLLALAKDSRPKIRKRATEAVVNVLEQGKGGDKLAFDVAVAAVEGAASQDTQKLVHALQLLRTVVSIVGPKLSAKQIQELTALLLKVVRSNDQYVVLQAFSVFTKLPMQATGGGTAVVKAMLDMAPNTNDRQLAPAWLAVIAQAAPPILSIISSITPYLLSEHTEVVESAGQCLIALISEGTDLENQQILSVVATEHLFPLLQVKYHSAWATVCEVCAAFIAVLPYEIAPKIDGVLNIVRVVGALRTTANEADQVLGAAIRILGPHIVCQLVPLQLDPRTGSGRAWMLPLLAEHVGHTKISYFFQEFAPLAAEFELVAEDLPESRRSKILHTIADQLYTLFPKFCDQCTDTIDSQQLQEVLGWLYSKVQLRPAVCLGLKFLAVNDDDEERMVTTRKFVSKFGSDILKALFNVFQSMSVESRGYILETAESYLERLPKPEVTQLFNQVSTLLAQSLQNENDRHTMMDITNAILPFLGNEGEDAGELGQIFINLFKTVGTMNDPLMQKKAYRALCLFGPKLDNDMLAELLLEMQDSVQPNARRTRLQALLRVVENIQPDGDFSFVFKVLPEAILGVKDPNEKTRETAFEMLVICGHRFLDSSDKGGYLDHSRIRELRNDDSKNPVSINSYFEMVLAGLAGSTPHMVAATVTALARVLFEFHNVLVFDKLQEYIELVWMLLDSPSREIVGAVLGFVKVSVLMMSTDTLIEKLPSLLTLILAWSNEHKNHFKSKVRHLIERLLRRVGYEALEAAFPEKDKKLLHNIHKSKERARRKRHQPVAAGEGAGAAAAGGASETTQSHLPPKRKYENEFDQALYGSDSESESDGDDGDDGDEEMVDAPKAASGGSKKKGGAKQQFIIGGNDPIDLLDEKAMSHISSTKPNANPKAPKLKHHLPESKDGRLVIGDEDEADRELASKNALSAYMDAVKSGPVRTQSGKLKYLRGKRAQKEDDGEEEEDKSLKPNMKGNKVGKKGGKPNKLGAKKHMQNRRRL